MPARRLASGTPAWVPPTFAALLAALIAGSAAFLTIGAGTASRADVREALEDRGEPWSRDRPVVEHRIEELARAQRGLTDSVQRLSVDVGKVVQRLDDFLKAAGK